MKEDRPEMIAVYNGVATAERSEFITELEQFLRDRNVQLSTSGYDGLQIRDLEPGEEPIYCAGIEDLRGKPGQ